MQYRIRLLWGWAGWVATWGLFWHPMKTIAQRVEVLPERAAYVAMLRADQERDSGATDQAVASYAEALELFLNLSRERPDYKKEIIARRIGYCRAQIDALRCPPTPPESTMPTRPSARAMPTSAGDRLIELEKAFTDLQNLQSRLNDELKQSRREREALQRARDAVEESRRSLAARLMSTEERLADVERRAEEVQAEARRLAQELEQRSNEVETLRSRLQEAGESKATQADEQDASGVLRKRTAGIEAIRAQASLTSEAERRLSEPSEEMERRRPVAAQATIEREAQMAKADGLRGHPAIPERQVVITEAYRHEREQLLAQIESERARRTAALAEAQAIRMALEQERDAWNAEIDRLRNELRQTWTREQVRQEPASHIVAPIPAGVHVSPAESRAMSASVRPDTLEISASWTSSGAVLPPDSDIPRATDTLTASTNTLTVKDWLEQGERSLLMEDYAAASAAAEAVLRLDAKRFEARLLLARAALGRGDLREARRLAEQLARDFRDKAAPDHLLGLIAEREKNLRLAARHFRRAVALDPQNALYHRDLALAFYAAGRLSDAIEELENVVRLNPNDGRAHFNLAALLASTNEMRLPDARAHYARAIELGEDRDEVLEKRLHP